MFRSFVYLDEESLGSYAVQLGLGDGRRFDLKKARVSANLGVAAAEMEAEKVASEAAGVVLYDHFEKELSRVAGTDYFDFLEDDSFDCKTLPPMSLFRFRGFASVPEEFDMIETIGQFAPLMGNLGMLNSDNSEIPRDFLLSLLSGVDAQVPVLLEGLDITVSSKLKTRYLSVNGSLDIEAIEGEEVVFLCKVESCSNGDKVVIYDPLRDFMKLNRTIRRNAKRSEGFEPIAVDGPVLKAELVAIYH